MLTLPLQRSPAPNPSRFSLPPEVTVVSGPVWGHGSSQAHRKHNRTDFFSVAFSPWRYHTGHVFLQLVFFIKLQVSEIDSCWWCICELRHNIPKYGCSFSKFQRITCPCFSGLFLGLFLLCFPQWRSSLHSRGSSTQARGFCSFPQGTGGISMEDYLHLPSPHPSGSAPGDVTHLPRDFQAILYSPYVGPFYCGGHVITVLTVPF